VGSEGIPRRFEEAACGPIEAHVDSASDPLAFLSAVRVLDTVPDAVSVCDRHGTVVYLNEAWAQLIGPAGRDAALYVQPDTRREIRTLRPDGSPAERSELAITRALAGETVRQSEVILLKPDGEQIFLETNAAPIHDGAGNVIGAIASSHDVTRLRHLEAEHSNQRLELQQKVQELEMIISSMADGVLITDAESNTLLTNPAFDAMIGYQAARYPAAKRFHELHFRSWDGRPLGYEQTPVARALAGEKFSNQEFLVTGADGRDLYERVSGGPLCDAGGTLVGGVFLVRDVTHLREADRDKLEFVSLMAHELRTPITLIRGFSQVLNQSLRSSASQETLYRLAVIDRRTAQLSRLITDLLDVTRMEVSAFSVQPEVVEYRELATTVAQEMAALKPGRHVDVHGPDEVFVRADPLRIHQVLINLIDNAFTHGPPATAVRVVLRRESGRVVTRVADDGPALPASERRRIFDRFYQAGDSQSGSHRGMGLGLYISRRIVEAHGGEIWVESGEKSSFAFSLPMVEMGHPEGQKAPQP
jgi:PAS domain S-box-containing protein